VQACGMAPIASHRFPDHHHYTAQEVADILLAAAGVPIVTTAKDAVKLRAFPQLSAHVFAMDNGLSDARPLERALERALQR
jgi:tetraacyldisaccharide-1-P 4'-kinase